MKKLTLVLVLTVIALSGIAQQVNMSFKEVKGLDNAKASGAYFLTKKDGLTIIATNKNYYVQGDIGTGVVIYGLDEEGKAAKTLVVTKQKESMLVAANAVEDTVYMVVCGALKNNPGCIHVFKASLSSWSLVGEPKLLYHRKNKGSNMMDWKVATSPDGHVTALSIKEYSNNSRIAKAFGKEEAEYDALIVTDNRFSPLWQRDDLPGWYNTLTIDDEEAVHAMLVGVTDKNTYFLFANHSSMSDEMFLDSIDRADIGSCRLLNYVDGHFVAGGTIGEKRHGLHNIQYSAIFGLSYDTHNNRLVFNPQPLTPTEFAVLENRDLDSKRNEKTEMQGLTNHDGVATPFGGVMQLWNFMTTIVYSKGSVMYIYDLFGSLMVAVDKEGKLVWRVPVRNHIASPNDQTPIRQHITYHNGHTYVVQTENSKSPTEYDLSEDASRLATMTTAKATLAIYAIDDGGKVSKYTLPQDKLLFLTGKLQRIEDDWYVTVSKLKKCRLINIKGF